MSVFTETVTSYTAVEVYGGLTACLQYLGTQFSPAAATFTGLTPDDQKRCLIAATRYLEEQIWQGTANPSANPPTVLSWPRSNVTDRDGNPVSSSAVPTAIVNGCFEMAAIIAQNPQAVVTPDANQNVQSMGEGPAHVTFFAPPVSRNPTMLPEVVRRLVGQYLSAIDSVDYGASSGVSGDGDADGDDTSAFADSNQYTQTRA